MKPYGLKLEDALGARLYEPQHPRKLVNSLKCPNSNVNKGAAGHRPALLWISTTSL